MTEPRGPRFRAGEEILNGRYVIVHQDGRVQPTGTAGTLDGSGSGAVYRVVYAKLQDRVLKVLTPPPRKPSPTDYHATFELERNILARLSHGSIIRLFDFGDDLEHDGRRWQYHVTEWVEGLPLLQEMKAPETDPHQVYSLISQLIRAIRYMHELGVAHADIKHENVRCRRLSDKTRQAVLLDLGCARFLGHWKADDLPRHDLATNTPTDTVSDPDSTQEPPLFASSPKLVHRDLKRYLNKPLTPEAREIVFPFHDIYAFGILLDELLSDNVIATKLAAELGVNGMRALQVMQDRIEKSTPTRSHYNSVSHLYRDWEKLRSNYLAPAGVPELGLAAEFKYSLATPLGRVVFTPRLSSLTAHKIFVRLGEIPQLELLRLKYSGASHTRLQHSAGVLRNTRYYVSHLLNGPVFRLLVNTNELEAALILALLHDIGHYQLSHLFEDYASEQKRIKSPINWNDLKGEAARWHDVQFDIPSDDDLFLAAYDQLSPEKLEGDYGEVIRRACKRSAKDLKVDKQPTIGELTRDHFSDETYEAVVALHESVYRRKPGPPDSHIAVGGVLSSGLDADKVSYLMQDATETGVRFGLGIDLDGLLGSLRSPSPDDIANASEPILAITTKGLAAAESVLTARKLMYERVYWHPANRAMTAMVKYCITRLLSSQALHFPSFLEETFFQSHQSALRILHDRFNAQFKSGHPNPIAHILEGERSIHRELLTFSKQTTKTGKEVATPLLKLTVFEVAALEDRLVANLPGAFDRLGIGPGDILLDVPAKDRSRPSGDRGGSVLVYEGNSYGRGTPLNKATRVAADCIRTHDDRSKVCRVFVSRKVATMLDGQTGQAFEAYLRDEIADFVKSIELGASSGMEA